MRTLQPGTAATSAPLRWLDIDQMALTPPRPIRWVIEDFAAKGEVTVLAGKGGTGKSLLALTLAVTVDGAESRAGFHARTTATTLAREHYADCAAAAVVIDAENSRPEIHRRIASFAATSRAVGIASARGLDLTMPDHRQAVIGMVSHAMPDLIVFDSLTSVWSGDENNVPAVRSVFAFFKQFAEDFTAAVVVLHHRGKGEDAPLFRGSSAIEDAPDLGFAMVRQAAGSPLRRVECFKSRLGPEPPSRWVSITEGVDGRVCVEAAEPPKRSKSERPPVGESAGIGPLILSVLAGEPKMRSEVAEACSRTPKDGTVRRTLHSLVESGLVVKDRDGRYRVTGGATGGARHPWHLLSRRSRGVPGVPPP